MQSQTHNYTREATISLKTECPKIQPDNDNMENHYSAPTNEVPSRELEITKIDTNVNTSLAPIKVLKLIANKANKANQANKASTSTTWTQKSKNETTPPHTSQNATMGQQKPNTSQNAMGQQKPNEQSHWCQS
ncbi:hypothetical protein SARC_07817 [Sphaeroforma arctica JP610]|uniref:Uncharacterized protein n=1 Tax=Sphaeroforma arctica JP610 TaxID=667725 RepID=A0A0L0FSP6_9EUKA|nr:hypothetical protein SARC_07817 [Sphaeroforma arctica JP610]KNC79805.1 hypothetical protein SARC_07817 [Sphaeroforma arctica JP610]|eukprot:XP_014153707.1 hypothetical protein SARC_07817 [Sphaeroforma arctica JP610]